MAENAREAARLRKQGPPAHVLKDRSKRPKVEKQQPKDIKVLREEREEVWRNLKGTLTHICNICVALFALTLLDMIESTNSDLSMVTRDVIIAFSDFVIAARCILIISCDLLPELLLIGSVIEEILKGGKPPPSIWFCDYLILI